MKTKLCYEINLLKDFSPSFFVGHWTKFFRNLMKVTPPCFILSTQFDLEKVLITKLICIPCLIAPQ